MSAIQRHFLGWDSPFLPVASKWLQENYLQEELGNAKEVVAVVQSSSAARRLQSLLVTWATKRNRAIDLPSIMTSSNFLRRVQDTNINVASSSTVILATAAVMQATPDKILRPIVGTTQFDRSDFTYWIAFAEDVTAIASEIMSGSHDTNPDTWPNKAKELLTSKSIAKFKTVDYIHKKVLEELALENTQIRDHIWHDLMSATIQVPKHIVLLGTTDLNEVVQKVTHNMSCQGASIDVVIRAPETMQDHFDVMGCVIPEMWENEQILIPEDSIEIAGSPSSQATVLIEGLTSLCSEYSVDDITIAITDEKSIPIIRRQLEGYGVSSRYAGGSPVSVSPEVKLVQAIHDCIKTRSFSSYASLIRHPFISNKLGITSKTIHELDSYYQHHLPSFVSDKWFTPQGISKYVNNRELLKLHAKVMVLLGPLFTSDRVRIAPCSQLVRSLLLELYGDEELDIRSKRLASLNSMFFVLDSLNALPLSIQEEIGEILPWQVMEIVLSEVKKESIPEYPDRKAIEVVGWLESLFDDSPCLFVVGMDSSLVSPSSVGHQSIPNQLRQALGLNTTERQLARDAHAVTAMQHERSVKGTLKWIVARKSSEGESLTPNPLLLRCDDDIELAERAKRLIVAVDTESPNVPSQFCNSQTSSTIPKLVVPTPDIIQSDPIRQMSVTAFKNFLACPYRFWLRNVLKLDDEKDDMYELDYALFGILVHGALEDFGKNESIRNSTSLKKVTDYLLGAVDGEVQKVFGKYPFNTIKVQAEMAKHRLRAFAEIQVTRSKEGWSIVDSERKIEWIYETEPEPFNVIGKIDRIDQHEDGRIQVLDYKTSSKTARSMHGTGGEWNDLQLPIYRHLADSIGYPIDTVETGYVLIGSTENAVKFDFPKWDDVELQSADDVIATVIEQVINHEYQNAPVNPPPPYCADLSWICQDNGLIHSSEDENL